MGKHKKNQVQARRQRRKAVKKATRRKEVKKLRAAGWPSRERVSHWLEKAEAIEHQLLDQRLEKATSIKALKEIAKEYGIEGYSRYKSADREQLEAEIRAAADTSGLKIDNPGDTSAASTWEPE